MAKFRPIFTQIWQDDDFHAMQPIDKLLFIYFITNPHTSESGIYHLHPKTISDSTLIPIETVTEKLQNNSIRNILYDSTNGLIYVRRFKRYNRGGQPALIRKAIFSDYKLTHFSPLWMIFFNDYPEYKDLPKQLDITVTPNSYPQQLAQTVDNGLCQPLDQPTKPESMIDSNKPLPLTVTPNRSCQLYDTDTDTDTSNKGLLREENKQLSLTVKEHWRNTLKNKIIEIYPSQRWGSMMLLDEELNQICNEAESLEQLNKMSLEILSGIQKWKLCDEWAKDKGQYIPNAFKFIRDLKWKAPPTSSTDNPIKPRTPQEAGRQW